ncbi:MAG: YCF48-related protein [Desulfuromonadales bacterium]|nr:YCF48-related protein [Desulfuromonadales bacterium]
MSLFALALFAAPDFALAADSQIMPLAEKSLLLDGQVVADKIIVVGERGHILISEDLGFSWQQQQVPTRATLTSVFFVDPLNGWAAGHAGIILRTRDGGRNWQEVYSNADDGRPILDIWFRGPNHGFAVGAYGLLLATEDAGETWMPLGFNPATLKVDDVDTDAFTEEEPEAEAWGIDFHLNQIAATASGRVYIAAEAGNLYRSDDGCRSWISLPSPYEGSFYGTLPLKQASLLAYGLRGHLFRSEDAGINWAPIDSGSQATLNDGIHLRDGRIALAGLAGTLLISGDDGHSFELFAQEDRAGIAKILQAEDGALILIGEQGVKRLHLQGITMEAGQ